ncbi:alpha/beta hydrolase [Alicyclobacillus fructus]|uniref:alpha/beta hydrolase n=1 Tax=Alicyclobacillus fructus TaxID=2816082 RepID=UPI001A8EE1B0|nr:alpha/beta hydrolase [Alicyclobacillus fructus]
MEFQDGVVVLRNLSPTVPVVEFPRVYRHAKRKLSIHFFYPPVRQEKSPVVLYIQGCAFGASGPQYLLASAPQILYLVSKGFVVGSVEHTYSYEDTFPAAVIDVIEAVRYVKREASELGVDPERIGIWGASSGGNLAAMVGVAGGSSEFVESSSDCDGSVRAVVDWFGPTDFLRMNEAGSIQDHDAPDSPESLYIGAPIQEQPELASRANPITYVTPDRPLPPFLICHGDKDPFVPYQQSELLYRALKEHGHQAWLVRLEGEGHGTPGFSDQTVLDMVVDFFAKYLC